MPEIPAVFVDPQRMRKIAREIKGFACPTRTNRHAARPCRNNDLDTRRFWFGAWLPRERMCMPSAGCWRSRRGSGALLRRSERPLSPMAKRPTGRYGATTFPLHADPGFYPRDLLCIRGRHGGASPTGWLARLLGRGIMGLERPSTTVIERCKPASRNCGCRTRVNRRKRLDSKVAEALPTGEPEVSYAVRRIPSPGLPITSSHIESTIKQINRRSRAQKILVRGGGEASLQLGSDYLSDTDPMTTFWKDRPNHATGLRRYQTSGKVVQSTTCTRGNYDSLPGQAPLHPTPLLAALLQILLEYLLSETAKNRGNTRCLKREGISPSKMPG